MDAGESLYSDAPVSASLFLRRLLNIAFGYIFMLTKASNH
jgi:hypothetical protein